VRYRPSKGAVWRAGKSCPLTNRPLVVPDASLGADFEADMGDGEDIGECGIIPLKVA
jgi:hypothetical protein